jgi:tRNA threonylcarbamoyladenosine biosynthesis protein TsaE
MEMTITSNSPEETLELGRRLGERLKGGEILALSGPLGSGKTHLVKGIALGAGARDRTDVTSPTFVIINQYAGRLDIYHLDAYRLDSVAEFEQLGFDDLCYPESVVVIEWADRVESALREVDCVRIELAHAGEHRRIIRIRNLPDYLNVR